MLAVDLALVISLSAAVANLCMAMLHLALARAPGWRLARLFAVIALSAASYNIVSGFLSSGGFPDVFYLRLARLAYFIANLHCCTWILYAHAGADGSLRQVPERVRWMVVSALTASTILALTGLGLEPRVDLISIPWAKVSYHYPRTTHLGDIYGLMMPAVLIAALLKLIRRFRAGERQLGLQILALGFFLVTALDEVLVANRIVQFLSLADLGFLFLVVPVSYQSILRITSDARRLHAHSLTLRDEVADRTVALAESEERYRLLVETSPDGICLTDLEGRLIMCNPCVARMHGFSSAADLSGLSAFELIAMPDRDRARIVMSHTLSGGMGHAKYLFLRQDGSNFPGELSAAVVRDTQGKPVGFMALTRDITAREKADAERTKLEHQLRHAHERYRTILDSINDAVFVHHPVTGEILEVNATASRMYGYSAEDLQRLDVAAISAATSDDAKAAALKLIHTAAAGVPQLTEWQCRRSDGTVFWSEVSLRAARVGGVESVLVVVRDIDERKRAEVSLRREQELTERIIDAVPGIFFVLDERRHYVRWNKAHERLFGMAADQIPQLDALERIHPDDRPRVAAAIDEIYSTGSSEVEARGLVGVGPEVRHFLLTGRKVEFEGAFYCVGFGIDTTARREAEAARAELQEQLLQSQRLDSLGRLAGGVAHDFNNLLTVINGYCDLLLLRETTDVTLRPNLELIRQAGERAAALTHQLLAFSRKQVSQLHPVAVNDLVAEVVQLTRRLLGEHIELVEQLGPDAGQVLADSAQLHQMFMNLMINARDAMPAGGRLVLCTSAATLVADHAARFGVQPGEYARLAVSDNGVGMDEHVRAHVFEPFFTTKPAGQGTGLGLSTAFGIVRSCGGVITVESRPGHGSTFEIHLPRFLAESTPETPIPALPQPARATKTILIVEDEQAVRQLAVEILSGAGHQVLQAANADEALRIADHFSLPIDLLLTDMVMPGRDGRELASAMRLAHPESQVLIVTGYSESLFDGSKLDPGLHVLPKPFTAESLIRRVDQMLGEQAE